MILVTSQNQDPLEETRIFNRNHREVCTYVSLQTLALGRFSLLISAWIHRPGPKEYPQWLEDGLQHSHPLIHSGGTTMFRSNLPEIGATNLYENHRIANKIKRAKDAPKILAQSNDWIVRYCDLNSVKSQLLDLFEEVFSLSSACSTCPDLASLTGGSNYSFRDWEGATSPECLSAKEMPLTIPKITKMPLEWLKIVISSQFPLIKIHKNQEKFRKSLGSVLNHFKTDFP